MSGPARSTSCLLSLLCLGDSELSVLSAVSIQVLLEQRKEGNLVITMGSGKTLRRRTGFIESLNISARRKEEMSWAFQLQRDGRGRRYTEDTRSKDCETGELEPREQGGLDGQE